MNETIGEGEMGEQITVKAFAPPYVLCRGKLYASDECTIEVKFSFEETSTVSLCPNGKLNMNQNLKNIPDIPNCMKSVSLPWMGWEV